MEQEKTQLGHAIETVFHHFEYCVQDYLEVGFRKLLLTITALFIIDVT